MATPQRPMNPSHFRTQQGSDSYQRKRLNMDLRNLTLDLPLKDCNTHTCPTGKVGRCNRGWQKFVYRKVSLLRTHCAALSARSSKRTSSKKSSGIPFT